MDIFSLSPFISIPLGIFIVALPFIVAYRVIKHLENNERGKKQHFPAPEPNCKECQGTGIPIEVNNRTIFTHFSVSSVDWMPCRCVHPHIRHLTHTNDEFIECKVQRIDCRDERDKRHK